MAYALERIGMDGQQWRLWEADRKIGIVYREPDTGLWSVCVACGSPGNPYASVNDLPSILSDAAHQWHASEDAVRIALGIGEAQSWAA